MSGDPTPVPTEKPSECVACHSPISSELKRCEKCGSGQDDKVSCKVCGQFISPGAKRCNKCNNFQDRFHLTALSAPIISLLIGLFGAATTLLINLPKVVELFDPHSHTNVAFHSATDEVINLTAINTGHKPSILRRYWLEFDDKTLPGAELAVVYTATSPTVTVVGPGSQVVVSLSIHDLPETMTSDQLRERLKTAHATLRVAVHESDDKPNGSQERFDTFPATAIESFVSTRIFGKDPS